LERTARDWQHSADRAAVSLRSLQTGSLQGISKDLAIKDLQKSFALVSQF
jgi:hypothetical protein